MPCQAVVKFPVIAAPSLSSRVCPRSSRNLPKYWQLKFRVMYLYTSYHNLNEAIASLNFFDGNLCNCNKGYIFVVIGLRSRPYLVQRPSFCRPFVLIPWGLNARGHLLFLDRSSCSWLGLGLASKALLCSFVSGILFSNICSSACRFVISFAM